MRALKMEFFKTKHKKIPLVCLAFILVQLIWFSVDLPHLSESDLSQGWQFLLYNIILIDAIMLPMAAGVIASRSCEIEHKGNTLKLLETLQTPRSIYHAKLIWGTLYLLITLLLRAAVFTVFGFTVGFSDPFPLGEMLLTTALSFLVSVTIYLLEQNLALLFSNQAIALVVGIFGSFAGFLSLLFPPWVQKLLIWGYYGVISPIGMNWDPNTRISDFFWRQPDWSGVILTLFWFIALFFVGRRLFQKKSA